MELSPTRDTHEQWARQAVRLAFEGAWKEAIELNKRILEAFPDDVQAYNRLGHAYNQLGKHQEAAAAYRESLQRDPANAIALRNLQHLAELLGDKLEFDIQTVLSEAERAAALLLEEPVTEEEEEEFEPEEDTIDEVSDEE